MKAPAMSSKEQKAMKKSAKRPRVDKTLPSDDSRNPVAANPADSPAVGTSEMGSLSSGSDLKEAREPVPKRMQNFKGDVNRLLREKRKQFEKDVNASFRSLNENLQGILKAQQNSREELKSIYCETFGSLHQKWLDEVDRTKDEEEHLSKAKDLSQHRKTFIGSQQTKVEKEIAKVQDRVIVETQEQDVSVVQTYLQSLFHDCSEETI
uniref:XLR/SYCP3/FAM9 domain-containing protein n=2 Tax=Rattus norvegicus TaxID=10116 RepID=M0RCW5_RAT